MTRFFTSLIIVFLFSQVASAQVAGGVEKFHKLFDMYAMEEYQNCAFKAENYTMNDKYRKDPEPWGYIAMCYTKIYEDPELIEEFPTALKEALKYAYKFMKKANYATRKELREEDLYEANMNFINHLKHLGLQVAFAYAAEGKYSKAASQYKKVMKIVPDDHNVRFMTGVCNILNRNVGTGKIMLDTAMNHIPALYAQPDYKADKISQPHLISAFILYSDYLYENDRLDSAKSTISIAKMMMPDNNEIKVHYYKVHGLEMPEDEDAVKMRGKTVIKYKMNYSEKPGENDTIADDGPRRTLPLMEHSDGVDEEDLEKEIERKEKKKEEDGEEASANEKGTVEEDN